MSKKNPYWWFQGDSVDLLREQLVSANSAGQGARLEVKIDAKQNMTLRIVLDATAHFVNPWIVSTVYPISQAAIILAVIAERNEARVFMWLLIAVGLVTILTEGVTGPTLFLETVAAASIVAVVWPLPLGRLRLTLLVAFGVGFLAWVGYVISPGWTTWGIYQAVRALSLVMFCWASLQTRPRLQIA
jgi:hypothetical protein